MAGGDASQVPAALDPSWINRKFEAIEQWQREMMPSVAQTVTQMFQQRVLNTASVGAGLVGFAPPFPNVLGGMDGATLASQIPANAVKISVTGEVNWRHTMAATGSGTIAGYIAYGHPASSTKAGSVMQSITGTITAGKPNDLHFPFAFQCGNVAQLIDTDVSLFFTITGATFNGADSDIGSAQATITYGLA